MLGWSVVRGRSCRCFLDMPAGSCSGWPVTRIVDADYLVVGAGAMGMAFTDALIDHADVRVALVDRRHGVGGHWLEAYPFVRLHQSSAFYGVASTLLGGGRLQQRGPEAGLQERAASRDLRLLRRSGGRMLESGRVEFFPNSEYVGGRTFVSRVSGERFEVPERCRIVDAHYLAPDIPAETPPPFGVAEDARVIPVNDLARSDEAPSQYVIVGSGKTATDACIWLLARGVDPDAICWVRPRDPWMLNRAVVQPDPAIFFGMVADMMQAQRGGLAGGAVPPAGGRRHHAAHRPVGHADDGQGAHSGHMGARAAAHHRERRTARPHQAGRPRAARLRGRSVAIADDALVVHCAADGLKIPPLVPVWQPGSDHAAADQSRVPVLRRRAHRVRRGDARRRRREEPAVPAVVVRQLVDRLGEDECPGHTGTSMSFISEPDIKAWADQVALNPSRIPPDHGGPRSWTTHWSACRPTWDRGWPGWHV